MNDDQNSPLKLSQVHMTTGLNQYLHEMNCGLKPILETLGTGCCHQPTGEVGLLKSGRRECSLRQILYIYGCREESILKRGESSQKRTYCFSRTRLRMASSCSSSLKTFMNPTNFSPCCSNRKYFTFPYSPDSLDWQRVSSTPTPLMVSS